MGIAFKLQCNYKTILKNTVADPELHNKITEDILKLIVTN